jgi:hypothetical protein
MPSLKEILILMFVLFGCWLIAFSASNQSVSEQGNIPYTEKENITSKNAKENQQQIFNLINNKSQLIKQPGYPAIKRPFADIPTMTEQGSRAKITNLTSPDTKNQNNVNEQASLSLETVLAEVENLVSDLKLELNNAQYQTESCPSCNTGENKSENLTTSICAAILATPGGGGCSCASLGCLPETGPLCVHPCCCVCCPSCCK